jgi:hypothetical protein
VSFTVTASGIDSGSGSPILDAGVGGLTVLAPAKLVTAVLVLPSLASVGQWVQVTLTVTNTGGFNATGVSPAIQVNTASALVALQGTVTPPGPVLLAPGGCQGFTWTFSVSGAGLVGFTATASGTDAGTGNPVLGAVTESLGTVAGGLLSAAMSITPSSASARQWVTVRLTVTNSGGVNVADVNPCIQANSGGGLVVLESGPAPAGPVTLGPGVTQTFAWTYSVSGAGMVAWTATGLGTDAGTGYPVLASAHGTAVFSDAVKPQSPTNRDVVNRKLGPGDLLIAPNVFEYARSAGPVRFYVRGDPGGSLDLRVYDETGEYVGFIPVRLDDAGYGDASFSGELGGKRLGAGLYRALARGAGVNGRKTFVVLLRGTR